MQKGNRVNKVCTMYMGRNNLNYDHELTAC